ncbi:MAG: helix-turn-helix domain-containing protein [Paludibacter sp.]|nr:helix-turn-helix domain-containing protein [Paludibacter sp.]
MFLKYITFFSGINYLIFATVLLIKKSPVKKANRVLSFLFLLLAAYSVELSFYYAALLNKNYSHLIHYVPFDLIILLALGPSLYRFVKVLLNQHIKLSTSKILIQFLPFIPAIVFIIYFLLQDTQTRLNLLIVNFEQGIWHTNLLNLLVYFQMTFYLFLCYNVIQKQLKKSSRITIDKVQMNVSWLKVYIVLNLSFMLLSAPLSFYLANEKANLIIAQLAMIIQFVYLFVKSTWQTGFFTGDGIVLLKSKEISLKIDNQVAADYYNNLTVLMELRKPYLKEDCNIQTVSEQTGISVHHISNILNNHINKSFPDFINEYRINEAKKMLCKDQNNKITLEAVGFECGFGSKSSFNKAFKKLTNLTPSEFRQQNKCI